MRDDTESTAPLAYPHCDSPSPDQPASPTFKHSLVPLEPLWANDFPHGLTPPPESLDPGELYPDYQNSIYSAGQPDPNSTHSFETPGIRQPPTPPRAELSPTLHKSPSGLSGGSQDSDGPSPGSSVPTPEAIFPEGDVKMMDLELDGVTNTGDEPGLDFMGFSDEMATQEFGEGGQQLGKTMTEFFDFESAASSPLNTSSQLVSPNPNSKFQLCSPLHGSLSPQPQPFQHTFSAGAQSITNWCAAMRYSGDNGLDNNSNGVTPARPSPNRVNRRKRALPGGNFDNTQETSDEGSRPVNISPPARKMVTGSASGSFGFANFGYPGLSQQAGIPFEPIQPFGVQQVQLPLTLSVDQIPAKSRVETQILVKLHLSPFPKSVTKLHLPRHCISKPKLYAKPPVKKSPDMLELHASLVCASAMRKPEVLQKALARARDEGPQPSKTESQRVEGAEVSSGEDSDNKDSISRSDKSPSDEESPLMGGEVKICVGCISRERKRAARKKPKQIKEEEEWVMDEPKRAVVFNNHEVREWLPTSGMQSLNGGMDGNGVLGSWEDGMIMELHMRLACYCRHQGEKEGFRVIFTIKNHEDVVIAQQITSSILITDDHKSSAATPAINGGSQDIKLVGTGYQPPQNQLHQALFGAPVGSISSHDNQSFNAMGSGAHGSTSQPPSFSQNSFSPPPSFGRNMSPASPMSSTGLHQQSPPPQLPNGNPTAKKRRINSVPKVPAGLTMTRMDNPRPSFQQQSGPMIMNNQPSQLQAPALNPFSAAQSPQAFWTDEPMTPSGMSDHAGFQFDSTQNNNFNGLDNRSQFASPQSARPSRAPSPSPQEAFLRAQQAAPRIPMHLQSQVRHVQTHTFQAVPPDPEASQIPEICRLVPHDGTCRGGIEVTVLGRSFVPGLTVLFGETPASHNYFFSPTTMVCLLPPNAQPGPVVVSIRNVQLGTAADKVRFFTYVNDADKSLMELALQIVGMKMRGTMSNPQDIARSIIEGDTGSAFGQGSPRASQDGTSGSQQHQQYLRRLAGESGFGRQGLEGTLLKFLDAMDLDESPYPFPLHLKNKSGQTMLHLASMLNMGRFVAALLARGASVQETDANGYTPLHFAALHRHLDIYRRLLRHNANPNLLTRNGDNAIDLVFQEGSSRGRSHLVSRSRHQSRASSASSENHFGNRSRVGSSASLSSMWDPNGMEAGRQKYVGVDDFFGATDESSSGDGGDSVDERWMHSRRGSRHETTAVKASLGDNVLATDHGAPPVPGVMAPPAEGLAPAAAVTAWREQIAASIQNLQNLHWNLPTMPTAADYQHIFQNPMAALQNPMARFHALMPPSPFAQDRNVVNSQEVKKGQYTWWELFSAPQAPPAYEELFPHQPSSSHGPPGDIVLERGSAVDDAKVQEEELVPPGSSGSSSSASSLDVDELRYRISRGVQDMTKEQQDEYRAHARKMKKIESDRRLYFFWLPALILILIAMTMSYGPVVWCALKVIISFAKAVFNDPSSIKESMAAMASGVAVAGGFLEPRIVPLA